MTVWLVAGAAWAVYGVALFSTDGERVTLWLWLIGCAVWASYAVAVLWLCWERRRAQREFLELVRRLERRADETGSTNDGTAEHGG